MKTTFRACGQKAGGDLRGEILEMIVVGSATRFQPSVREMATWLGVAFTAVAYNLKKLEQEGRIRRDRGRGRAIEVLAGGAMNRDDDGGG